MPSLSAKHGTTLVPAPTWSMPSTLESAVLSSTRIDLLLWSSVECAWDCGHSRRWSLRPWGRAGTTSATSLLSFSNYWRTERIQRLRRSPGMSPGSLNSLSSGCFLFARYRLQSSERPAGGRRIRIRLWCALMSWASLTRNIRQSNPLDPFQEYLTRLVACSFCQGPSHPRLIETT